MKKQFQINNGFRNRFTRLVDYPKLKTNMQIVFGVLAIAVGLFFTGKLAAAYLIGKAGVTYAFMPLLKLKKDGLTGDSLKFMEDLEKRISLDPDSKGKEDMLALIKEAKEEASSLATRLKGIDDDKIKLLQELLGTDDKAIRSILAKQGEALTRLQAKLDQGPEDLSIRSQVSKWHTANKDSIAKLKAGERASLPALEIRVASPMTPANTLNGSVYIQKFEVERGATEIVRPRLTFWDYITKGTTGAANYIWVNKKNPLGAAGWIGPGVAKPGISLELASEVSNAKKIAASEKVALELLDDVEGFASYIEQELRFQVDKKTNSELMTGAGSATAPKGIQAYSTAYTLVGVATQNPNNWDAIRAAVAQLRAGNLDGAVTVFVNPVDKANMDLTKAQSQGQLFVPAAPDATIVEDNNIAVGYFQAAILANYIIKIYKDYTVTYGWENDDFTKNLVTLVGERRIHQFVKENYTGSFIYDTFANVKLAIAAA